MGFWNKADEWVGRFANWFSLWTFLPVSAVTAGTITAWIASGTAWIDQFGARGWWIAGLIGSLLALLIILTGTVARYVWVRASILRRWARHIDTVNPLDPEFHRKRIKLGDLAHPVTRFVRNKRF